MRDTVKKLRALAAEAENKLVGGAAAPLREAADVIEDLEEENADLYGELNHRSIVEHQQRNWLEEHKSFTQQVKALRGALREIAEFDAPNYKWMCQNMRRIAREALAPTTDKSGQ